MGAAAPSPLATSDGSPKIPPPTMTLKIVAASARTPSARTSWPSAARVDGSVMAGMCGGQGPLSGSALASGNRHGACSAAERVRSALDELPLSLEESHHDDAVQG